MPNKIISSLFLLESECVGSLFCRFWHEFLSVFGMSLDDSALCRWCAEVVGAGGCCRSTSGARQPRAYMVRRPTSAYRLSSTRLPRPTLYFAQSGFRTPLDMDTNPNMDLLSDKREYYRHK